ncbi:hypothetical protein [Mesorhizobium sp.]|uniref:hypothetical protein n=1 Tax=Mesorhizobium sp. TaxID=1871066 RepID=UPI0025EB1367|nr:hypothetical protein [Mesorhizobium sp.]
MKLSFRLPLLACASVAALLATPANAHETGVPHRQAKAAVVGEVSASVPLVENLGSHSYPVTTPTRWRRPISIRACAGRGHSTTPKRNAPWSAELGDKEDTARETHVTQHVQERVHPATSPQRRRIGQQIRRIAH